MVVADLSNVAILSNACWGSPRSKNEAMGAKIHQTPFRLSTGCLSSTINKILVLNVNENFSTIHPAKVLHFLHNVPYGLETIGMRFGGVKKPFWAPGEADFNQSSGGLMVKRTLKVGNP